MGAMDDPAGGTDDEARPADAVQGHVAGVVNYGRPAQYDGPAVPDPAPLVNPSYGDSTGGVESGPTDINPQGPGPTPGGDQTVTSLEQAPPGNVGNAAD